MIQLKSKNKMEWLLCEKSLINNGMKKREG